jgi:hypothetical protein
MQEKTEQPAEHGGTPAVSDDTIVRRRALMLKLAAGAFGAPVVLAKITSKAAADS